MLEFVEGTLSPALSSAVARHIKECPSCMHELEGHSSRTRALQKLGRVKAPDQWPEIRRSIRRAGWVYFARKYALPAAVFGASAALVLVAMSTYMKGAGSQGGAVRQVSGSTMLPAVASPVEPVRGLLEAAMSGGASEKSVVRTGVEVDAGDAQAELGALEADHYGNLVGQFLDDGAVLALSRNDG